MSAYLDILGDQTLIVDDESGEVIAQQGGDRLAVLAQRRHDAKMQERAWAEVLANYDRVLLANDAAGAYGTVVINRRQRNYAETDVAGFAQFVIEEDIEGGPPHLLWESLHAARGFNREALPEEIREDFDRFTTTKLTKPWIESAVVRQVAPKLVAVPAIDDLEEQITDSIAHEQARKGA